MKKRYSISLREVKEDEELRLSIKNFLEQEYLNSFLTMNEFCNNHDISLKALKYCLDFYGLKKDKSKFNNFKKEEIVQKIKATKLERYGDEKYNNPEANKATFLRKYGVTHNSQIEEIKKRKKETFNKNYPKGSPQYKELMERSARNRLLNLNNFGDKLRVTRAKKLEENPSFNKEVNLKRENSVQEKYGYSNVSQSQEVKNKKKETYENHIREFEIENDCTRFSVLMNKYGQSWKRILNDLEVLSYKDNSFLKNKDIPKIEKYVDRIHSNDRKYSISLPEKEVLSYIKSIYKGEILENRRDIIEGKELDIYIPDKKLAIEFNGMYWHSSNKLSKDYHLHKLEECQKRDIRLINIFEDNWDFKQEICKSIISSGLGIYNTKIYARECECREVPNKEFRSFLENNHLSGFVNSSIRLGLYYKNELVQVIGLGKSRYKKGEMELYRMCSKLYAQVVGGFSKLLSHLNIDSFISYIDRSVYTGSSYINNGFEFLENTPPSYFYWSSKTGRINRLSAQKHKLKDFLDYFNPNLSEIDNMLVNGYLIIYDCGNMKVRWSKK